MTFIPIENLGGGSAKFNGVIYDNGTWNVPYDNSGHNQGATPTSSTSWQTSGGWEMATNSIKLNTSTISAYRSKDFCTNAMVKNKGYSKLCIAFSNSELGTVSIDISSVTSDFYLTIAGQYNGNERIGVVCLSSSKDAWEDNRYLKKEFYRKTSAITFEITKIWLEK